MSKDKKTGNYKFQGTGLTTAEKRWGLDRFQDYIAGYPHIHKLSDLHLLEELVFQEAMHERLKEKISKLTKNKKDTKPDDTITVPANVQKSIIDGLDLQFKLKEKLSFFEDKAKLDAYKDIEDLKIKFAEYRRRNPLLFKTTCPHCSEYFFLKRRTDCYEEIENMWFKDKVLCNPELWEAYKNKEITKLRMSKILGTAEDYIDWLEDKFYGNNEKKSVEALPNPSEEAEPTSQDDYSSPEQSEE